MSKRRSFEAEFETALVRNLNRAGAFATREFRVPGTASTTLDIYIASPVRAFVEIKLKSPQSPLEIRHLLQHATHIYHLFGGEVVPILVVAEKSRRFNNEFRKAGILVVSLDDTHSYDESAKRCAKIIWDFLTRLPYEFTGLGTKRVALQVHSLPNFGPFRVEVSRADHNLAAPPPPLPSSSTESLEVAEEWRSRIDIFADVLVSFKSILSLEQFEVLNHELLAFSEEYYHAHYTACGLRVGRTLEHVVYALARAWGVNVNRTTLQILADLENAFEQLARTVVDYAGSENTEKIRMRGRLEDKCQLVSNKLLRLVFDLDAMQPETSDVPVNVEALVRDIKKRFAARAKVRKAVDAVAQNNIIRKILDIRNSAAHAHVTGARRELSQIEVDEAVELLRTALFLFSNVAFAVAEKGEEH